MRPFEKRMSRMRERRKSEERNEGNKESGGRKDERNREWDKQREHKHSPSLREKENKWQALDGDNTSTAGSFPTCSKNEPLIMTCLSLHLRAQASKINSDKIADSVSFSHVSFTFSLQNHLLARLGAWADLQTSNEKYFTIWAYEQQYKQTKYWKLGK